MPSFSALLVLYLQIFLVQNVGSAPTPIDELEARHEGHSDSDATPSPTSVVASDFQRKNGVEAQKLNGQFTTLKATDGCQDGQQACVQSQFGQCVAGKWVLSPCAAGTTCFALPLVNKPGTSLACDSQSDANARFVATGVQGGPDGSGSPTSTASATRSTSTSDPEVDSGEDDCDEPEPTPTGTPDNTDDGDDCDPTPTGTGTDDGEDCDDDKGDTSPSGSVTPATLVTLGAASLPTGNVFTRMTVERRQIFTILTSSSRSPVIAPATSSPAATPAVVTLSSASPSTFPTTTTPTPTPTVSTPNSGVVTPTIAVGTDGIVTVTVVSVSVATVTVTATQDCRAIPPAPAAIPSSSVAGTVGTIAASAVGPSTLVSLFTSLSPTLATQPTQTVLATPSPSPPNIFTSLQAAEPPTTSASSSIGGILFSTQVITPTSASSPTGSVNISELLTATLS